MGWDVRWEKKTKEAALTSLRLAWLQVGLITGWLVYELAPKSKSAGNNYL